MRRPASKKPSDFPPSTCCWTVFIVSSGARSDLEQTAASPEASVFFSPAVTALDSLPGAERTGKAVGDSLDRPPRRALTVAARLLSLAKMNNRPDNDADVGRSNEMRFSALIGGRDGGLTGGGVGPAVRGAAWGYVCPITDHDQSRKHPELAICRWCSCISRTTLA